jgi:hypothetical protein
MIVTHPHQPYAPEHVAVGNGLHGGLHRVEITHEDLKAAGSPEALITYLREEVVHRLVPGAAPAVNLLTRRDQLFLTIWSHLLSVVEKSPEEAKKAERLGGLVEMAKGVVREYLESEKGS